MRVNRFAIGLILPFFSAWALSTQLFVYTSPTGERVVTDRPITLQGYVLEQNQVSPTQAGLALRYQNNETNRALIDRLINNAAYLYNVDAALIRAVIRQESAYKIDARSHKGAMGLMQLMPATAQQYRVKDILDPRENIYAGTRHLRYLMSRYDDLGLVLAAYNAGEGAVRRFNGIPPYPETENYVKRVLAFYQQYQNSGG